MDHARKGECMAKFLTARQFGDELGLTHLQVISRLRKRHIRGKKWGWAWAIPIEEVERVKEEEEWYKKLLAKQKLA